MTQPGPVPRFPTSLGTSDADTITLLGRDLAADLMGQVSFGELALWLVTQRRPTPSQVRVFEAVLVALATTVHPDRDRGPADLPQRPGLVQGALAAGLLGGGSRFLGVDRGRGPVPGRRAWPQRGEPRAGDDAGLGRDRARRRAAGHASRGVTSRGWAIRCTR